MRKFKRIALALVLFMSIFVVTGCKERKPITTQEFQKQMENKGYSIYDASSQFSNYDFVKEVYIAKGDNYQIEFFVFENDERAKNAFEENKENFENKKGSVTTNQVSVSTNNFDKYHLVSNNKYMTVSRINNTMIFATVDSSLRSTVLKDIEDLGY